MFPTQSKVNRIGGLVLLPVIALAMLLVGYALFTASSAQAQTPAGEFCIEGIVIDWEENPLAGWEISLTGDVTIPGALDGNITTTVSAMDPDDDDDVDEAWQRKDKKKKNNFKYPEDDPDLEEGEFEFTGLLGVAGTYTASIESRPGWEGVTPTTLTFPIEIGEDDCVRIRFKMRRVVPVTVYKIDANHIGLGGWKIKAVPGPGNLFASPVQETTAETATNGVVTGSATFSLTPGLWIFTEMAPDQDKNDPRDIYQPIVPPNGRQELFIPDDIGVTESLTVVFKNELVSGCFIVQKTAAVTEENSPLAGGFGVAGWGFKLVRADGKVIRQGVTDGRGQLRFDNLPLGPYTLVEEDRPGWNEISPNQLEIDVTGNMCDDEELIIEFVNEQDDSGFCIEGRKIDANGGYGIMGWEITIEALDEGGALPVNDLNDPMREEIDSTFTDGVGRFRFDFVRNDYRVPGAKYEVCEVGQDGWLPHNPTCQIVRLPEWPGACVKLDDFVNQQVGHSESEKGHDKDHDHGKGDDHGKGGPSYGHDDIKCSSYHVVKAGEGLFDIGKQYNKTPQQMLDANPSVRDGEKLWVYVGQRICIP